MPRVNRSFPVCRAEFLRGNAKFGLVFVPWLHLILRLRVAVGLWPAMPCPFPRERERVGLPCGGASQVEGGDEHLVGRSGCPTRRRGVTHRPKLRRRRAVRPFFRRLPVRLPGVAALSSFALPRRLTASRERERVRRGALRGDARLADLRRLFPGSDLAPHWPRATRAAAHAAAHGSGGTVWEGPNLVR